MQKIAIYLFRQDLRLEDNPSFSKACANSDFLIPIYCRSTTHQEDTQWGFQREGLHRRRFLDDSLKGLSEQLRLKDSDLFLFEGYINEVLQSLISFGHIDAIYCEDIVAPEEQAELKWIRKLGIPVHATWQSSMIDPEDLPFSAHQMPEQFTQFRIQIEKRKTLFTSPIPTPQVIPPLPVNLKKDLKSPKSVDVNADVNSNSDFKAKLVQIEDLDWMGQDSLNAPSSFPYWRDNFRGGELFAKKHLRQYLKRRLPHSYKKTRNELFGVDYSSKFSPYLANGSLSPRVIMAKLREFENEFGANDGSYWLWFELLWRDYFRILHLKWGKCLYGVRGLGDALPPQHCQTSFRKWCLGETGESIVDAGMRELRATGYLSNRLRQVVASYLIYDLNGDWRAGAAWFESQLIDYDVYSNQGNWLYIAGRGTDPRGGRRFNPQKQANDHDSDHSYRSIWLKNEKYS
ncbi:MAG: hypothetical protein RIQ84_659 [Pseudomonadota bacterium]|jgi:deoxyribodipyrimidine photo-lyase